MLATLKAAKPLEVGQLRCEQVVVEDGALGLVVAQLGNDGGDRRAAEDSECFGAVVPGDWLLVFLDDARERIDTDRATEVNAALDLVLGAMQGLEAQEDAGFALQSQMSPEQMRALTGA